MSGKSQTIRDFTFCRPSQILSIYRIIARTLEYRDYLRFRLSGMGGDKSGMSGAFYFPNASQISAMVGDHSRQMKTRGRRWWFSLVTNLLNCWAPVSLSYICVQIQCLAHFPFPAKFNIGRIWTDFKIKIWDCRQKVKSLIVWDFPDIWKPGFRLVKQ